MDPQQMLMMLMQQGGAPREHPLSRAFGGMPMYGGSPIQPSQMFDLSGLGLGSGSTPGMMVGMLMQGLLPGLMGPNFIPGQFTPTQNFFDHRYAVNHFLQRRRAIELSAQADQETYFRMIRGMARMTGVEYQPGGEQEAAARRFSRDISSWGPILGDMMPEFFDRLHGTRGSAQMFARNAFEASRYTFDPVTGRLGSSGDSAGAMTREAFNILYGPGADLSSMRGLGAGRAGQIYDEMVRRGFGPSVALDRRESMADLRRELTQPLSDIRSPELQRLRRDIGARYGVADDDTSADAFRKIGGALESLGRTDSQTIDVALRSFNATRVAQSIQNMAGAVSAMRDIFGDMGRPNAPMVELINGLQAMTQGGLSYMTPQQIERSVRQSYAIAKYTGLGLEGIMGFAGTAAQVLDQQGISRALAPQIAQGAATYGFAFGLAGQPTQFGAADRELASQLDIRLRSQAAASPQAIRLAAVMRFADEFQRKGRDGTLTTGFDEGSEAYALSEAIRAGQTEYEYRGNRRSIFQAAPRINDILAAAGVNRSEAQQAITRPAGAASKLVQRYGIEALVREGSADLDVRASFGAVFARSTTATLSRPGMVPGKDQGRIAQEIGPALFDITRALFDEDVKLFDAGREGARNNEIARRLRARLGDSIRGISDAELANLVGNALETAEDFVQTKGSGYEGYRSFTGVLQLNSRRTAQLRRKTVAETRSVAQLQEALSAIGQEGLASRISDYIQNVGPGGGNIQDLIFRALGGIQTNEVAGPLQALFSRVSSLQAEYESSGTRFAADPERRRIEQERIFEEIRRLGPDISKLVESGTLGEALPGLSPEARRLISQFQKDQAKPADGTDTSVAMRAATQAQQRYAAARQRNIDSRPEVIAARRADENARRSVAAAQARYDAAVNTPDVRAARASVAALQKQLDDAQAAVREAEGPKSTVTAAERAARIRRRDALRQRVFDADKAMSKSLLASQGKPAAQAALLNLQKARTAAEAAQRSLAESRAKAGTAAETDPEVQAAQAQVAESYKKLNELRQKAGLPDVATPSAQQTRFEAAQARYRKARDAALEKRGPVKRARKTRDDAATQLQAVQDRLSKARGTPAVEGARKKLSDLRSRREELDRQIQAAERKGDKATAAKLRRDRQAVVTAESKASESYFRAVRSAESGTGVQRLRKEEAQAQEKLNAAQRALSGAIDAELPSVNAEKDVSAAQEALEQARKDLPPGTPVTGVGTVPSRATSSITSRDTTVTGTNVAVSSPNVRFNEVPRLEIQARDLYINGQNLAVGALKDKDQDVLRLPDPVTGTTGSQKITGVLRIEGLDRAVLEGQGTPQDARSLV